MPANIEAEQGLIGCVLMNNGAYARVAEIVRTEHFREDLHRRFWKAISTVIERGGVATPVTLKTFFGNQDLGGITAGQYLARLAAEATTIINAPFYAMAVRDLALRRRMIEVATDVLDAAYDSAPDMPANRILAQFEEDMGALRVTVAERSDFEDFETVSMRALEESNAAYQREGGLVGLSTGLQRLDDALGGLQRTDLIVLAGRPGMGKTALATNIGFSVAQYLHTLTQTGAKTGVVGFFSLEMSKEQLAKRILSEASGVPDWRVKRGFATEDEMIRLADAQRQLRRIPLVTDATGGLTIGALSMRARSLKKRRGLELLIVDYLQLLKGADKKGSYNDANRAQEVAEITVGLKALAKELDIPIIALSQLSRRVEERDDKRPHLADLRESGSIEQDADSVLFVYREEYYLRKTKPPHEGTEARAIYDTRLFKAAGVAEVIIGKNRHGPEGVVILGFDAPLTKFKNEPDEREDAPEGQTRAPRKKAPSLPKEALRGLAILRSLTLTGAVPNDNLEKVPRGVRPVPYTAWRAACAEEMLDIDRSDKQAASLMEKILTPLRNADLIGRGGTKDAAYVWVTDKGEK